MEARIQKRLRWGAVGAALVGAAVIGSMLVFWWMRAVVSVTQVVEGPVVAAFYATGTLAPEREFPIKSNVAGTITEVRVDKGERVRKGELLAIVRSDDLPLKLGQAKAELAEKQSRANEKESPVLHELDAKAVIYSELVQIAQRDVDRQNRLKEQGNGAQIDLDRAQDRRVTLAGDLESIKAQRATKWLELEKDLAVAKAALEIAQWNYDQQNILSPVDGVVLDRPVSRGTRLAINDHVMQVADVDPSKLLMRAQVDEEDRVKLKDGQKVNLTLYSFPGHPFAGRVAKIYPQANVERRTFEVDVRPDAADAGFAAGMTGELAFEVAFKSRAAVVPAQAVQGGAIWVVREGKLHRTEAVIGLKSVERVEVLGGLNPGDFVLISPIGKMSEGDSVRLEKVDPRTAALLNRPAEKVGSFKGFN